MKSLFPILLLACVTISCNSQNTNSKDNNKFDFSDITFYSSRCNGTCPDITMSIDSHKKVQLIRQIYISKSVQDTSRSGGFKGELSQKDFDQLISLIKEIDWKNIDWPKTTCCDLPVKTIMVGINGSTKNFRSMTWPKEADQLIKFLTWLGTVVNLPAYTGPMDFEVMNN